LKKKKAIIIIITIIKKHSNKLLKFNNEYFNFLNINIYILNMNNILFCNFFIFYVILYLVLFTKNITAKTEEINILIKEPEVIKYTAEDYSKAINDFIISKDGRQEFVLKFSFCSMRKNYSKRFYAYHYDKDYIDYLSCVIDGLKNGVYDMVIMDDRHLFAEVSLIENFLLEKFLKFRQLHIEYDILNRYNFDINYHNSNIVNDGCLESIIYGLPYEMDFDVIYTQNTTNEFPNNISWIDLLNQATNSTNYIRPVDIPIGDNDELLNFFTEYTNEEYNLLEQKNMKNRHYFDVFYNEKSSDLFNSFRDYINTKTKLNTTLSIEQSINSFINRENVFYKGKASEYWYIKSKVNQTISIQLPPKYFSVITEKFLVINTHGKNKTLLEDVARKLTSKNVQQFRSEQFGSIPTFDIKQKETDPIIKQYCDSHFEICHLLEKIKPIRIKDFFKKDELSASFLEVRIFMPEMLKTFLNDGQLEDVQKAFKNIAEIRLTSLDEMNIYTMTLIILMVICALCTFIVMYYVYKYRNHSHLKDLSPVFCNIIIFGFILCYFFPLSLFQNKYVAKCKIFFFYSIIYSYLIILPMFMITFRVYYIYSHKTKVSIGKKLSNKRLSIIITTILSVIFTTNLLFGYINDFYLATIPSINMFRYSMCFHENYIYYNLFSFLFNISIVSFFFILFIL